MKRTKAAALCLCALVVAACGGGDSSDPVPPPNNAAANRAPVIASGVQLPSAVAFHPVSHDLTRGGTAFSDPDGDALTFELRWQSAAPSGLTFDGARIVGTTPDVGSFGLVIRVSDGRGGQLELATRIDVAPNSAPQAVRPNDLQLVSVGGFVDHDVTQGNTTFSDPEGDDFTLQVSLSPVTHGLSVSGTRVSGVFDGVGAVRIAVTATDEFGATNVDEFLIAAPAPEPGPPNLPSESDIYADEKLPLPPAFRNSSLDGLPLSDTTPADNRTSDAGATLGRVLFYDKRLSVTNTHSCGSCHEQQRGFTNPTRFSEGVTHELTRRNSMGLTNVRYNRNDRFFWDQRATTLEELALMPIQEPTELGNRLPQLVAKLATTDFYPPLFEAAFGTPEITDERIAKALAQFLRALISYSSKFDEVNNPPPGQQPPDPSTVFTPQEREGLALFQNALCSGCHQDTTQVMHDASNNGLDETVTDPGLFGGRFRSSSLRNIARSAPYMHDGRIATLREVIEHYDHGVVDSPDLAVQLRDPFTRAPKRLNLTGAQIDAFVAFLNTLTDEQFLSDPRFSDPFQ